MARVQLLLALALVLVLVAVASVAASASARSESEQQTRSVSGKAHKGVKKPQYKLGEAKKLFDEWAKDNRIKFKNAGAREKRFQVFKKNLAKMNSQNTQDSAHGVQIGANSAYTFAEFLAWRTGGKSATGTPDAGDDQKRDVLDELELEATALPDSKDWRAEGKVGPIRNQGRCGSCWAFASAGVLETHWAIKHGVLPTLSPQNIIDCATTTTKATCTGCNGGCPICAFQYVFANNGLHTEDSYPYSNPAAVGSCRVFADSMGVAVTKKSYQWLKKSEKALRSFVGLKGTIAAGVCASEAWMNYGSGILMPEMCDCQTNHVIQIVGYGTFQDQPVWIIKNSWGTNWGYDGYAYVYRGLAKGTNSACQIHLNAFVPVVA